MQHGVQIGAQALFYSRFKVLGLGVAFFFSPLQLTP